MKEQTPKKILVVEEQIAVRDAFLGGLRAKGFRAIGAENGHAGIHRAQACLPDLIACCITMPEPNGFTVFETLGKSPETAVIPFVFIASSMSRIELHKAMELGASGYLVKPCTVEELIRIVVTQLGKQSLLYNHYAAQTQPIKKPNELPQLTKEFLPLAQSIELHGPPLNKVFHFIIANYRQPIALNDVAQAVGYSPSYLTNLMKRQTGQTVQQWIIQHRMVVTCSLLLNTDQSVEKIADQAGYQNSVHFFRQFRRFYGTTPKAWRNQYR